MRSSALALRRVTMGASASRAASSSSPSPRVPASGRSVSRSDVLFKSPFATIARRSISVAASSTSSSDEQAFARFAESQRDLPRPTLAEEARTILSLAGTAVLSTADSRASGHPAGSVVQYALSDPVSEGDGPPRCSPVLALSSMSSHTRDLAADPRCGLTVLEPGFRGMEGSRVSLTCVATRLSDGVAGGGAAAAREAFKRRHPDAFWVDFGDFSWWRLDPIGSGEGGSGSPPPPAARVVAGFGRAGSVSASELSSASPDPVAAFSAPVSGHMNADHADAVLAVARSTVVGLGPRIAEAKMGNVDRLGFEVEVVLQGEEKERLTARIPFPEPAEDRKALKERLVEMTRAAAAAKGG